MISDIGSIIAVYALYRIIQTYAAASVGTRIWAWLAAIAIVVLTIDLIRISASTSIPSIGI